MYISRRETFCYIFLAVFTLIWVGAFSLLGMDLHHDGIMFKAAVDAAEGKWIFKEVFCQYGILSPLLQGGMLRLFGNELAVLKLGTVVFYAGIVILNDLIWKRFLAVSFRVLNIIMFFVLAPYLLVPFHIWSSVYALFFMMLAAEFILLAYEKEKDVFFYLSGICAGLIFGFRWPCGVVTVIAQMCAVFLFSGIRPAGKQALSLAGGILTVLGIYSLYLTIGNAWGDCFKQIFSFVGKFAWKRGGAGSLTSLVETFLPHTETTNFIFAFIPVVVLGLFLFSCRRFFTPQGKNVKTLSLLTLLLFGLASYHQYYPVPCVRHLYWGSVPMMGAYAYAVQKIFYAQNLERYKKGLYITLLFLPLVWGGFWRMYGGIFRVSEFNLRQSVTLPGLRFIRHGRGEKFICDIAQDLRLKDLKVFNYTADGIWSVILPESKGFKHPMFVNWGRNVYADYPEKVMAYIDKERPAVLASTPFFHLSYVKAGEFQYMGTVYSLYLARE
jgi:hypothetical protein